MVPLAMMLLMPLLSIKVKPICSYAAKESRLVMEKMLREVRIEPIKTIVTSRTIAGFMIILVISCPISIFLIFLFRFAEVVANRSCYSSLISELFFSNDRKFPDVEEY